MIPAAFDYVRAGSLDEAVRLLGEHGEDAKLIAGGHSLLPMMKLRLAFPSVLIDICPIEDAAYVRVDGDEVAIGALTRHCDLVTSDVLRAEAPLIAAAAAHVGDRQIRHRGTIGGSISHADPAADLPAAVLASEATLVVQGPSGRRSVAAVDFFQGYFETALEPDEVLAELRIPRTGPSGYHYEKFTLAADGTEPVQDMHADADYRRHLARVLTRRSLQAAAA
jgi:carbon-monoxide dehydrogenase medium subunit